MIPFENIQEGKNYSIKTWGHEYSGTIIRKDKYMKVIEIQYERIKYSILFSEIQEISELEKEFLWEGGVEK